MSGITGYSSFNQPEYFYKRQQQGASGIEIVSWDANNPSSAAAAGVSGVSGASGMGVEELTLDEVIKQFSEGNLTVSEMEKWLQSHNATYSFSETNSLVSFKFTFEGQEYEVSCTKEASASQLDNITFNAFYSENYISKLEMTDEQKDKYFVVAKTDSSGNKSYMINPDCGCNSYSEVKKAVEAEKAEAAKNETEDAHFNSFIESVLSEIAEADKIDDTIEKVKNFEKILHEIEAEATSLITKQASLTDVAERDAIEKQLEQLSDLRRTVETKRQEIRDLVSEQAEAIGKTFGDE